MKVLLVHQNFPGQFRHLSPLLAARGDEVVALTINIPRARHGARVVTVPIRRETGPGHRWTRDFETKIIRAEAAFHRAQALRAEGFVPDLILAHPGWGDTMFLKVVWPEARFVLYCEYFYRARDADHDFDPEFALAESPAEAEIRTRLLNLPQRMQFDDADAGLSPTRFQAATYPASMQGRITVIHDGIDTDAAAPGPARGISLADGRRIAPGDEIVTFVSRTLEPYRGFHTLLRAWPAIQRARPAARLAIVGRDGTGYGAAPPAGTSWKSLFLREAGDAIDPARVLFTDAIDHAVFLNLMRLSTLHVYLTRPFILSWSVLEAMASGCAVLGSDTAPVREFVDDGRTGVLVPFADPVALADAAIALLADAPRRRRLGDAARALILARVDLRTIVRPALTGWLDDVMDRPRRPCS